MSTVSDSLRSGGKRARIHDAQIVTKVPTSAKNLLNEVAQAQGVSDAQVVRDALAEYFEKRGYRK